MSSKEIEFGYGPATISVEAYNISSLSHWFAYERGERSIIEEVTNLLKRIDNSNGTTIVLANPMTINRVEYKVTFTISPYPTPTGLKVWPIAYPSLTEKARDKLTSMPELLDLCEQQHRTHLADLKRMARQDVITQAVRRMEAVKTNAERALEALNRMEA